MSKIKSFFLALLAFGGTAAQAATVWQAGNPGRGWPVDGVGGGWDVDFVQEAGVNPLPGDPNSPAQNQQADDDYYFAGVYTTQLDGGPIYEPVGVVESDETAAERAFAGIDNSLRFHFNLTSVESNDLLSVSWEAFNLHEDAALNPDPRYGIEVYFNGILVAPETIVRPVDLKSVRTTAQFSLAGVNARIGPGYDNYIHLRGVNHNAEGGGNWMGLDYVALHAERGSDPNASTVVTNTADSGPGSLRQILANAPPGATITFAPALSGQTILLTGGQITVNKSLTLDGSALPKGITVDGNLNSRILLLASNSPAPIVTLDSLTFTRGSVGEDAGGAIFIQSSTSLIVRRCTFHDNHAAEGSGDAGAILSQGQLRVENSTFTGNTAADRGGAVRAAAGTATFQNVTITGNSAFRGGGINNDAAILNLTNTIVAANSAGGTDPNIQGLINADANNLRSGDPQLAPLGHYGGPTKTMLPLPGSPAIDPVGGLTVSVFATDQRGLPRVVNGIMDIGAVEAGNDIPGFVPLVTTTSDSVNGLDPENVSLREAILFAPANSTITFASNLSGSGISLTNGQLRVNRNMTIDASGLGNRIVIDGNTNSRIFEFASGTTNSILALVLRRGTASGVSPHNRGGAIYLTNASLTASNCIFSANTADYGGGLFSDGGSLVFRECNFGANTARIDGGGIYSEGGTLTFTACGLGGNGASQRGGGLFNSGGMLLLDGSSLTFNSAGERGGAIHNNEGIGTLWNCTLSRNQAYWGGGIFNSQGSLMLNNCTVARNASTYDGGGILNDTGSSIVNLTNTIVAGNSAAGFGPNVQGTIDVSVKSLIVGDPLLAPLAAYGGRTFIMPPLAGSPAIDEGGATTLTTDQRGFPRLSGSAVDIGAVEAQFAPPGNPPFLMNAAWSEPDDSFQFAFTNVPNADFTVLTATNLPSAPWIILGPAIQSAPGQYEFHDPAATNHPQRYYRVVSP